MNSAIDLRSDTVTQPTEEMREAMAGAVVGDDVYGEDPTVNQLEELAASRMGKEAAVFVVSGTMGNLAAILAHCGRGDEVILGDRSHTFLFEAGGLSALGGVHPHTVPNQIDGSIQLEHLHSAIRADNPHFPVSRLICIENTHNRSGGHAITVEFTEQTAEIAHQNSMSLHLDGARIFNGAAALGVNVKELVRAADSVTFCISKALCAPVGSVLCGSEVFISKARRIRKQLGGGMRQAGILAAARIVALGKMVDRLPLDHARAKVLAQALDGIPNLELLDNPPPSNMLFVNLGSDLSQDASELAANLKELGILVGIVRERTLRLVIHNGIDDRAITTTIDGFKETISR
jgi:threonine aldolase